uniref:Uncharacterized protein n=1 Tax=Cacopsylla melanoneura TaxID=428564 RepID=A0A8D8Z6G7_9HEMI
MWSGNDFNNRVPVVRLLMLFFVPMAKRRLCTSISSSIELSITCLVFSLIMSTILSRSGLVSSSVRVPAKYFIPISYPISYLYLSMPPSILSSNVSSSTLSVRFLSFLIFSALRPSFRSVCSTKWSARYFLQ